VGASEVRRASSSMTMRGVFCRERARDDANVARVAREVREARVCRLGWFPRDETTQVVDAMRCDDALTR